MTQCFTEARLTPRALPGQRVREHWLQVNPFPAFLQNRIDYFGNDVSTFAVFEKHDRFAAIASSVVEVEPQGGEILSSPAWEMVRDLLALPLDPIPSPPRSSSSIPLTFPPSTELREYARPTFTPGRPLLERAGRAYPPHPRRIQVPAQIHIH